MSDQPTPRRRFQFRLRTLMIGVTLLAIYCGTVAWFVHDRRRLIDERDKALEREIATGERLGIEAAEARSMSQRFISKLEALQRETHERAKTDGRPDGLVSKSLLDEAYGRIQQLQMELDEQARLLQSRQ
jgi:hypothetical protein